MITKILIFIYSQNTKTKVRKEILQAIIFSFICDFEMNKLLPYSKFNQKFGFGNFASTHFFIDIFVSSSLCFHGYLTIVT